MGEVNKYEDILDGWVKSLDTEAVKGFVRSAMRDFLSKEFKWDDFVSKENVESWLLLTNDRTNDWTSKRIVVEKFLDYSEALDRLADDLRLADLIADLEDAGFDDPPTPREILHYLDWNEIDMCRTAGLLIPDLLSKGELPIEHMHVQDEVGGQYTWELSNVVFTQESQGECATYTMFGGDSKDPKSYYLDVTRMHEMNPPNDVLYTFMLQLNLRDDTGKWKETWHVKDKGDGLTNQVFEEAEARIFRDVLEPDEWEAEL